MKPLHTKANPKLGSKIRGKLNELLAEIIRVLSQLGIHLISLLFLNDIVVYDDIPHENEVDYKNNS